MEVRNIANARWRSRLGTQGFASKSPTWGLVQVVGSRTYILSKDGVGPSTWRTREIAEVVAKTPPNWRMVLDISETGV